MGDRIVVMDRGKIQQMGPPIDLYEKPKNRFVAGFLGSPSMNFFEGRSVKNERGVELESGRLRIPLPNVCREGESYVVGFRPEHLRLKSGIGASDVNFPGSVELVEPLGSDSFLSVDLGDLVVTVKEEGHFCATVGESLQVFLNMDQVHIFETETGNRVNS